MVGHVLDLATDPQVTVPGKGLVEGAFDLLVEAADGVDPWAILQLGTAARGPARRGGVVGRRLRVEELIRTAGHRRHPTDALSGHHHTPGGGTIAPDGESARWSRHGPHCGIVSRKVGTPQSRVLANGQSG